MAARRSLIAAAFLIATVAPSSAQTALVCINAGIQYKVGEFACIAACHGQRRLARCDVVAEQASWTTVSEVCPSAMIVPPWPTDWSEIPAVSATTPKPVVVMMSAPSPEIAVRIARAGASRPLLSY
ncbi:MAG TPA: hypothetical protein PKA74_15530 [Bauldia sp.]|nr:hypothetical protein [Bauldia sp.]